MGDKVTKKETDFWGNEKEVIYENGTKIGETRFRETWLGEKVQDHYGASGNKVGETKKHEGLFSSEARHYNTSGEIIGSTKDDITFFGNNIQRHFNTRGEEVGRSHYEQGFLGGSKKVSEGEMFKTGSPENYEHGGNESGGGSSYPVDHQGKGCLITILVGIIIVSILSSMQPSKKSVKNNATENIVQPKTFVTIDTDKRRKAESERINIRMGPSKTSKPLTVVKVTEGEKIELLEINHKGWYKIRYNKINRNNKEIIGWISSELVSTTDNRRLLSNN